MYVCVFSHVYENSEGHVVERFLRSDGRYVVCVRLVPSEMQDFSRPQIGCVSLRW